ncbi:hypothetical protein SAMN04488029_0369 [Reichenbachiella faecimaris]|uniref:Uncharacterized protein n=1 Tax=Reichenbachiella faecimaris TaxID=692418 RepID=A0A1W2G610_REIFA|nr:hypothetical protein [Reichenbachiella faecimaris]SMD32031.1 hypothetical protein SAMN04488029_0369 [Reichenbachiella faecimaris]
MKKLSLLILSTIFFLACSDEKDQLDDLQSTELPDSFTVDIPSTLSNPAGLSAGRVKESQELSASDIYGGLRGFIYVGENAADALEEIIKVAAVAQVAGLSEFTIESEDDGVSKTFNFNQDVTYASVTYDNEMRITDEDGDLALQVVWNTDPVSGTAILNPYYLDHTEGEDLIDTFYRLDYSESADGNTQEMTVSISGIPLDEGLNNLKMTVIKTGDIVEVFGNSNHPNLTIISEELVQDRNYAFRARADESNDIAVAEVALPPSSVETADVMEDYSIYTVLDAEIKSAGVTDQDEIDAYLANAVPPAYFDDVIGFLGAGEEVPANDGFTSEFIDLSDLAPYVPHDIANMTVGFLK